jgi:asparagine synthase (glutamine-hydrolysing)
MFAIALWDRRRRRLLLARDRYGIKPLYWRSDGRSLAFGSELKCLTADASWSAEVDHEALSLYLATNSVPAPYSILRGARKLEAGHLLVAGDGRVETRRWYRRPLAAPANGSGPRPAEWREELLAQLEDSVRAHLVADVPVGVFLSGGVDSGALCALAARHTAEPVRTFSIGFRERSFDELADARRTAERYGTRHTELVVEPDALTLLPELVAAYDEPFADSSAVPTYLVSRLAAADVKVVLSGEGGDEAFGGYEVYLASRLAPLVQRALPAPLRRRLIEPLVRRLPASTSRVSLDYRAKRFLRDLDRPPLDRHHAFKAILTAEAQRELLVKGGDGVDPVERLRPHYEEAAALGPIGRLQHVDTMTYLVDDLLTKTDRASMAHSLEARVPFVDHRLLEFAARIPDRLQVRGLQKKWLLREAVRPLLPEQVIDGRKRGFSIPAARWLRHDAQELVRDVLAPATVRRQGFFRPELVDRLVNEHAAGRADHSRQLWGLVMFGLWQERTGARAA